MLKSQVLNSATLKDVPSDAPFIIYRLPGSPSTIFAAGEVTFDGTVLGTDGIELTTWLNRPAAAMPVCRRSTPEEEYSEAVDSTVNRLRTDGGKTVLCRLICGKFNAFDLPAMLAEYFAMFPDMFCFCAYHPLTGYWMGASPELLLIRRPDGSADTRALAGTRPRGTEGAWDFKNIEEHRMVVDDIRRRAESLTGYKALAGESGTLAYGAVEHLATPIKITAPEGTDMRQLIGAIHPTAAIAGYPLAEAIKAIDTTEKEPRYFYGGTLISGNTAYVVLRCAHFDATHWCIFTGSGITAHSSASDEWHETQEKAHPLISLLNRF